MSEAQDKVTELVRTLVTQIVDVPEVVEVVSSESDNGDLYVDITVDESDIGHVIGRQGRIIKSIRTLARAAASQTGFHVEVELAD